MFELFLVVAFLLLVVYHGYVMYNVTYLVPKYGMRLFKFPFVNKVWKVTLLSYNEPSSYEVTDRFSEGYDEGYTHGRADGEAVARCNELTVKDLMKHCLDNNDFDFAGRLLHELDVFENGTDE